MTEAAGLDDVKTGAIAQSPNDLGGYSIMQAESKDAFAAQMKEHPTGDGGQNRSPLHGLSGGC